MRRVVIGAGDDAELVTLGPGVAHHSGWLVTSLLDVRPIFSRVGGMRRLETLVVGARSLVDLDHRLEIRIIIAPISSHPGRGSVRNRDAVAGPDVFVEQLGIVLHQF